MSNRPHVRRRHLSRTRTVTFADLDADQRIATIEHVLGHIGPDIRPDRHPEHITPTTRQHLDRMHHAMVDDTITETEWDRIETACLAYLATLDPAEKDEATKVDADFTMTLTNMPDHATSPGDWFAHVYTHDSSHRGHDT